MFWKKKIKSEEAFNGKPLKQEKLPKPKAMIDLVGMHLVAKMHENPDWVWDLYCVVRPRTDIKHQNDVRVFNLNKALSAGVKVVNYHSLDDHPDLVLFEGQFNKNKSLVFLEDRRPAKVA